MERLIVIALGSKPGRFGAHLERTGAPVVTASKQPLADGARELLARGFDRRMLLTVRHEGSAHDSFQPLPIGSWAGWTYEEGERTSLRLVPWMPFPAGAGTQKSTSEQPGVPNPAPEQNDCTKRHSRRPLDARHDKAARSTLVTMPEARCSHRQATALQPTLR
jgi:hypothetical protein